MKTIEESGEVHFAISHLADAMEKVWQRNKFNLVGGSLITEEMKPTPEQRAEWKHIATEAVKKTISGSLAG